MSLQNLQQMYTWDIETTTDWTDVRLSGTLHPSGDITYFKHPSSVVPWGSTIVTWNGCRFDFPVFNEFLGDKDELKELEDKDVTHIDGMILSKMLYPDRPSHSLDSYAKELFSSYEEWKPDDISWYDDVPLSELRPYLDKDLMYTQGTVQKLIEDAAMLGGQWSHPLKVEQRVATLTNEQVAKAVRFDVVKATTLADKITSEMEQIEAELEPWLPVLPVKKPKMPPKKQFKIDGSLSKAMENYLTHCGIRVEDWPNLDLPLTRPLPQTEKITLSNQTRLKEWLLSQGWKPKWWNYKDDPKRRGKKVQTSPRLNHAISKEPCPDLARFGNQGELISEWLMLRSRRSLLHNDSGKTGLIPRATQYCLDSGHGENAIPSDADTIGTPTARYRHKGIVNIPRVTSAYGKEFRELFCARKGYKWVGWDASSLEACCEAHDTFPFDPEYAMSLVEGDSSLGTDVHTRNMKALSLKDRDTAKTFKYAVTYGAQPPSLAEQLGVPLPYAQSVFDEFWQVNVGLRKLRDKLTKEWRHYGEKRIIGLDGRLISTRSEHSLINSRFQSSGAIIMKHAMLIANKTIKAYAEEKGIEAYGLIRYHDEEQWEVGTHTECYLNDIGKLGVDSITKAGQFLKLNVPIKGEYKIGNNWAETH